MMSLLSRMKTARPRRTFGLATLAVVTVFALGVFAPTPSGAQPAPAAAPGATPPDANPPPVITAEDPPPAQPGLLDGLGRLFDGSLIPTPGQTFDTLNTRAKSATDGLIRLTSPNVVNGRQKCPLAGNGAPDCKTASDIMCKAKGFSEGSSVSFEAAESCPANVLLSGRTAGPQECRMENFVTRANCQ